MGKAGLEMPFLVVVQAMLAIARNADDIIVDGQQEAAGAAGGVARGIIGSRIDTIDHPKDQFAGRVSGKALVRQTLVVMPPERESSQVFYLVFFRAKFLGVVGDGC